MRDGKKVFIISSINWHKKLAWFGAITLLIFASSAITHPMMSWFGPKQASFFPPQANIIARHIESIPEILKKYKISEIVMAKVIPAEPGVLLQVTVDNDKPRRYFHLRTQQEFIGYDKKHAAWLAKYYTGLKNIKSIEFQSEFDDAYPWVNRLLPVYKVTFDTDDNLTSFVYTEINASASLTNDWKTDMQAIFRMFHTWNWLDQYENSRIILMTFFLSCLFAMTMTGLALIMLVKRKKGINDVRKKHRLIAYIIWLPLLGFSASGTYHLLHHAYGDSHGGLRLPDSFTLNYDNLSKNTQWINDYKNQALNGISIMIDHNKNILYRLGLPKGRHGEDITKDIKYSGMALEKPAVYIDASTGIISKTTDRSMAKLYANRFLNSNSDMISSMKLLTHFGPNYDFRNKRLPVWQIEYKTDLGDMVFIDPVTGIVVDRITAKERYESYSFSFLHKWNFLSMFIGRFARDIILVIIMSAAIVTTLLGIRLLLKKN